jgi:hypothetical protein
VANEIVAEKQTKAAVDLVSRQRLLVSNRACEELIAEGRDARLAEAREEVQEDTLLLSDFATKAITAKMLKAYLHVRSSKSATKAVGYGAWPKKGTLEEADSGKDTLIKRAFEHREDLVILEIPDEDEEEEVDHVSERQEEREEEGGLKIDDWVLDDYCLVQVGRPSLEFCQFQVSKDWMTMAKASLGTYHNEYYRAQFASWKMDELQEQAKVLYECLWSRLKTHIVAKSHEHWVWRFTRANLSRVAALMVLAEHTRPELSGFVNLPKKCLLRPPNLKGNFVALLDEEGTPTGPASKRQGAYLFFDEEEHMWIRSGKASRPFEARFKDHKKGSELTTAASHDSRFYKRYPSKKSDGGLHLGRLGWFENLQMYEGLSYDPDMNGTEHLYEQKGGLFEWPTDVTAIVHQNKNTRLRSETKLVLIDYLIEVSYDLALAPDDNVSQSAGYERFLKSSIVRP